MTRLKLQLEDICLLPRLAAYKYMNINVLHAKMCVMSVKIAPCVQHETGPRACLVFWGHFLLDLLLQNFHKDPASRAGSRSRLTSNPD